MLCRQLATHAAAAELAPSLDEEDAEAAAVNAWAAAGCKLDRWFGFGLELGLELEFGEGLQLGLGVGSGSGSGSGLGLGDVFWLLYEYTMNSGLQARKTERGLGKEETLALALALTLTL